MFFAIVRQHKKAAAVLATNVFVMPRWVSQTEAESLDKNFYERKIIIVNYYYSLFSSLFQRGEEILVFVRLNPIKTDENEASKKVRGPRRRFNSILDLKQQKKNRRERSLSSLLWVLGMKPFSLETQALHFASRLQSTWTCFGVQRDPKKA